MRPSEEDRISTDEEWAELLGHSGARAAAAGGRRCLATAYDT
ncbi:MAG: hypothetical protein ACRDYZ_03465 [Acidimicrobiales bacterium]